jgi:6-pyruvoyltetrahydropterin/6-carboxytetrahydropterin synthase
MVTDYADIKHVVDLYIADLDHHTVNDIIPNSTAENIAIWLYNQLKPDLSVAAVTVHETPTTSATYRGQP